MATESNRTSWWHGPAGGREVLAVAFPLVISATSWTVMTFVDRIFLKWESGLAMSAAFSAGALWFAVLCLPLGICMYANTFVAQYYGDKQHDHIGSAVWQGVWIALIASPLVMLAIPIAPHLFALAGPGAEMERLQTIYFQILCAGAPALMLAQSFSSFYSGRGETRVVMWVDASFAVVNLILDYLWIFGHGGFPAMGIAGAAWATVASLWMKSVVYMLLFLQREHREKFNTWQGMIFDWPLFRRLAYYGGPSGMQMVLDVAGFTIFILFVGRLGALEAEATSMAFSISTFAFMPIWGFGLAASILVGQHLGENRDDLAARSTWTSLRFALGYMGFMSLLYIAIPDVFLHWFFLGDNASQLDQTEVRNMARNLLRFVSTYSLFDAMFMVFVNAIKGAGDTRFVLYSSLVMGVLLALLSWLSVDVFHLNIYACWGLITAWVCGFGMIFLLRFLGGKWRAMRVIEQREDAAEEMPVPVPEPALS